IIAYEGELNMNQTIRWGVLSTAKIAQKFSIQKVYSSYEQLLDDPDIDAVYIPLPNYLLKEWVIKAANKGKHILCEKPAALDAEEFQEMKTAGEKNKVIFMESFIKKR